MKIKITKTPYSRFAFGGNLETHGTDFSTGLVHIDSGGSHSENPNDGVQMGVDSEGTPNLVEEGETIFNDYVFSNRILVDDETKRKFHLPKKKDFTFADVSKRLEKESLERPNDPVSKAALKKQLEKLEEEQERQKAEMDEAKVDAAWEALSPEEKMELMQYAEETEQQEAQAQQQAAMEQEAMAQQQMAQQGMSPEQQMAMQQQGISPEEAIAQEQAMQEQMQGEVPPAVAAYGGNLYAEGGNLYPDGGELKKAILAAIMGMKKGPKTYSDLAKWLTDNNVSLGGVTNWDETNFDDFNQWKELLGNDAFRTAIAKDNPALAHVLAAGYDWGAYTPEQQKAIIKSIATGDWLHTNGSGWWNSEDPAWIEALETFAKENDKWKNKEYKELIKDSEFEKAVRGWTTQDVTDRLSKTEAYKKTNEWLKNSDNALLYFETLLSSPETPDVAKNYAKQFVNWDDEKKKATWKEKINVGGKDQAFKYDFDTVFGTGLGRTKGVRKTDPGTYWHSAIPALSREAKRSFLLGEDGKYSELLPDADLNDYELVNDYKWYANDAGNPLHNIYSYYRKKGAAAAEAQKAAEDAKDTIEVEELKPKYYDDRFMFAPIVGSLASMGLWSAGVGKPDWNSLVRAAESGSGAWRPAAYKTIGDYMTYNPMDVWANQNKNTAVSKGTDRAIMNNLTPVGTKNASLVANAYNTINANGDLYRKAEEYNNALESQVKEFNRGTNKYNADAFNQVSQFNAGAFNQAAERDRTLRYQAASDAMNAKAGWYNSLYGNIGKLADNLGNLGKFNANRNMLNWMISKGLLGRMDPDDPYLKDKVEKSGQTTTVKVKSEGGSVKRRKGKKRGLTF